MNFGGLSVTIPFKKKVLPFLDELSPLAKKLNCVNTVHFADGKATGYNFDGIAAVEPLVTIPNWKEKRILFLGFGGAAQGIILTLYFHFKYFHSITVAVRETRRVKLFNRYFKKAIPDLLAMKLSELDKEKLASFDIIINTTPLGMYPNISSSPLSKGVINKKHIIYDIVYNPLKTKLLENAQKKKAQVINGLGMFLGQASHQFQLWTNKKINFKTMKAIYLAK